MVTCKDCVHYEACKEMFDTYKQDSIDWDRDFGDCGFSSCCNHFKNKADFVEVKWISVKDRLPEKEGKYLCTSYYKSTNSLHINLYWFTKDFYKLDRFDFSDKKGVGGFWDSDDEWGICHHENVTHWMPLPELPKGCENNAK